MVRIKWLYYDRFTAVHNFYPFVRWFRVVKRLLSSWQLRDLITCQLLDYLFNSVERILFSFHPLLIIFHLEKSSYFLSLYIYNVPFNKLCKVTNLLFLCNWNPRKSDSLWNKHLSSFWTTESLWRQNPHSIESPLLCWLLLGSHWLLLGSHYLIW